jgi:serine/threonine protein kinase
MDLNVELQKYEKIIYDNKNDNLYLLIYRLGRGSFAQVWYSLCLYNFFNNMKNEENINHKFVALKISYYDDCNFHKKKLIEEYKKNKNLKLSCDNKLINIPFHCFEYTFNDCEFCIIVSEAGSCDLLHYFNNNKKISTDLMYLIIYKMCKAVELIHIKDYVFNDITPSNFIVFEKSDLQIKLEKFVKDIIIHKINKLSKISDLLSRQTNNNKNNKNKNIKFNYGKIFEKLNNFIIDIEKNLDENLITKNVFVNDNGNYCCDDENSEDEDEDEDDDDDEDEDEDEDEDDEENDDDTKDEDLGDEDSEDDESMNTDLNTVSTTYKYYKKNINLKSENKILKFINDVDMYIKNKNPKEKIYDKSMYYNNNDDINNNENIIIRLDNKKFNGDFNVKLSDVGKMKKREHLHGAHQIRDYRAPEIILGYKYNEKIDYWSLGCTIWELCTGIILVDLSNNKDKDKIDIDILNLKKMIEIFPDEENNLIKLIKNSDRNRKLFDNKLNTIKFCNEKSSKINMFDCFNINNIMDLNKFTVNRHEKISYEKFKNFNESVKLQYIAAIINNLLKINHQERCIII